MLKIITLQENGSAVHLKLEGKIVAQWAALLDEVCRAHLRHRKFVRLDCAGVDFIDSQGVEVINKFPSKYVELTSTPGFVSEVLHSGGRS